MTVLVAYASAHGSTKGVAQRVAQGLSTAGQDVVLRAADDIDDLRAYDAIVLGSAIHNGRWLTPATALLTEIQHEPPPSLWLFSVCTVGETTSFLGPRFSRLARRGRKLPAGLVDSHAPHRFFAGVINKSDWNAIGHLFFLATGGRYGDHRDWADIDYWTSQISSALTSKRSS